MQTRTLFLLVVAVAACGKKDDAKKSPESAAVTKEAPAKQPVTADLFGKKPAPFGPIAKLETGMTVDKVKAVAPNVAAAIKDHYARLDEPGIEGVAYNVNFDKDSNKLYSMSVRLPKGAQALLEKAWGPGKAAQDSIKRPRTYWFDADTGWRAFVEPGFGDDVTLSYSKYLPIAKLLGDAPDKLGFAPDGILDASLEDLRKRFPDTLVETNAETAAKQQADVSKFVGKDISKEVGKAKPSVRVDLPPTEWAEYWTRVEIQWSDAGKVDGIWFDVPYEAYAPAKEEARAVFEKHWGPSKPGKDNMIDNVDVYRAKAPWVGVADDSITHAWQVRIKSAPPRN
jgi:hypothetical protein